MRRRAFFGLVGTVLVTPFLPAPVRVSPPNWWRQQMVLSTGNHASMVKFIKYARGYGMGDLILKARLNEWGKEL